MKLEVSVIFALCGQEGDMGKACVGTTYLCHARAGGTR